MNIFDGVKLAGEREFLLKERIVRDFGGRDVVGSGATKPGASTTDILVTSGVFTTNISVPKKLKIASILFSEDSGSQLYTRLKMEAATRVGIDYEVFKFSVSDNLDKVIAKINQLNMDPTVTGIIIQKPWRKTWIKVRRLSFQNQESSHEKQQYNEWWSELTSNISEFKDVDGLHPNTIEQIKIGRWQENNKVLPATCRAVLTILDRAGETENFSDRKTIILGKSDLLGVPLYYELLRRNSEARCKTDLEEAGSEGESEKCEPNPDHKPQEVELIASKELEERMQSGQKLLDATIIISATGRKNLITGNMVSENVVVIDVGEPSADVEFSSVAPKSIFITPVPGGVGPMTVVSLLENCVDLGSKKVY